MKTLICMNQPQLLLRLPEELDPPLSSKSWVNQAPVFLLFQSYTSALTLTQITLGKGPGPGFIFFRLREQSNRKRSSKQQRERSERGRHDPPRRAEGSRCPSLQ